jgi:tRNA (adenine22-N1)-methyltransferase
MISPRLKSLASYVKPNDKVIDIGCDHAYLSIYLVRNGLLPEIIISDNKKSALQAGIDNVNKYALNDKITSRLGDGLAVLDENIDTAIISGMGARTILKMLAHDNLKHLNKIITQANNEYYLLRKNLVRLGFYIKDESFIKERTHYYVNIVFFRGTKKYSQKELKYGPILMKEAPDYFNFLLERELSVLKNIPKRKIFLRILKRKEIISLRRLAK